MEIVKHKLFGIGEVIKREGAYLTVHFQNDNSVKRFVIPLSFETGVLEAEGKLKKEIDEALLVKSQNKVSNSVNVMPKIASYSNGRIRKHVSRFEVTGEIATSYESYLIKSGYKIETDDGKPSTVYAYIKAINFVLDEEHISWTTLREDIENIVELYDTGGRKERLGNKSNKTVINALKRFRDFSRLI